MNLAVDYYLKFVILLKDNWRVIMLKKKNDIYFLVKEEFKTLYALLEYSEFNPEMFFGLWCKSKGFNDRLDSQNAYKYYKKILGKKVYDIEENSIKEIIKQIKQSDIKEIKEAILYYKRCFWVYKKLEVQYCVRYARKIKKQMPITNPNDRAYIGKRNQILSVILKSKFIGTILESSVIKLEGKVADTIKVLYLKLEESLTVILESNIFSKALLKERLEQKFLRSEKRYSVKNEDKKITGNDSIESIEIPVIPVKRKIVKI